MNLGFTNTLKTFTLLAALAGLLVFVGGLLGGQSGMVIALLFALVMNVFVYWKSDTLALKANGARELAPDELPRLRQVVAQLAGRAGLPMPASTSSTAPSPTRSRPVVTPSIRRSRSDWPPRPDGRPPADRRPAHELSHVKNRDTPVGTIAARSAAHQLHGPDGPVPDDLRRRRGDRGGGARG
jgi:heat shock protein HtpX